MAPHSRTLGWKIPWAEEPGRLQSMRSRRVGHDWVTWLSLFTFMHWRRKWQPTPVFLPGKSHGRRSLVGYSPWGHKESGTTQQLNRPEVKISLARSWALKWAVLLCRIQEGVGAWGCQGGPRLKQEMQSLVREWEPCCRSGWAGAQRSPALAPEMGQGPSWTGRQQGLWEG